MTIFSTIATISERGGEPKISSYLPPILIVADDSLFLMALEDLFGIVNEPVICIREIEKAVKFYIANKKVIQTLILDLHTSEQTLKDLVTFLRFINPNLKIIFSTTKDPAGIRNQLQADLNLFILQKPYGFKALLALVRPLSEV